MGFASSSFLLAESVFDGDPAAPSPVSTGPDIAAPSPASTGRGLLLRGMAKEALQGNPPTKDEVRKAYGRILDRPIEVHMSDTNALAGAFAIMPATTREQREGAAGTFLEAACGLRASYFDPHLGKYFGELFHRWPRQFVVFMCINLAPGTLVRPKDFALAYLEITGADLSEWDAARIAFDVFDLERKNRTDKPLPAMETVAFPTLNAGTAKSPDAETLKAPSEIIKDLEAEVESLKGRLLRETDTRTLMTSLAALASLGVEVTIRIPPGSVLASRP